MNYLLGLLILEEELSLACLVVLSNLGRSVLCAVGDCNLAGKPKINDDICVLCTVGDCDLAGKTKINDEICVLQACYPK